VATLSSCDWCWWRTYRILIWLAISPCTDPPERSPAKDPLLHLFRGRGVASSTAIHCSEPRFIYGQRILIGVEVVVACASVPPIRTTSEQLKLRSDCAASYNLPPQGAWIVAMKTGEEPKEKERALQERTSGASYRGVLSTALYWLCDVIDTLS
jgi:hypothetical protein